VESLPPLVMNKKSFAVACERYGRRAALGLILTGRLSSADWERSGDLSDTVLQALRGSPPYSSAWELGSSWISVGKPPTASLPFPPFAPPADGDWVVWERDGATYQIREHGGGWYHILPATGGRVCNARSRELYLSAASLANAWTPTFKRSLDWQSAGPN